MLSRRVQKETRKQRDLYTLAASLNVAASSSTRVVRFLNLGDASFDEAPNDVTLLKALASRSRLEIRGYLKNPTQHLPGQAGFDLDVKGVKNKLIAEKLGIGQFSVTLHMMTFVGAGLVRARRSRTRCFYKRNEAGLDHAKDVIAELAITSMGGEVVVDLASTHAGSNFT